MVWSIAPGGAIMQPGTRTTLTFSASEGTWRRATQAAIIEWRLDKHPEEFYVRRVDYSLPGKLEFVIEIVSEPKHLRSEHEIVNLILSYNPKGFALAFISSAKEYAAAVVQEVKAPMLISAGVLAAILVLIILYKAR